MSVYRVSFFTVTEVDGKEVRRAVQPQRIVAAKDHVEAAKLLPVPAIERIGEVNRNVVISCQAIHQNVIAAERLTLDEELAKIEAT